MPNILDQIKSSVFHKLDYQPFDIQPPAYFRSCQLNDKNFIFAEATEKNTILIDVSQFTQAYYNGKPIISYLREQYPDAIGIRFGITTGYYRKDYVEIAFESDSASKQALLKKFDITEGFNVNSICVSKPLPKNSKVIHIDISEIPFQKSADIHKLLVELFLRYGDILKMGIKVSQQGRWFTGCGYITLNVDGSIGKYKELLEPQIKYGGVLYSIKSQSITL